MASHGRRCALRFIGTLGRLIAGKIAGGSAARSWAEEDCVGAILEELPVAALAALEDDVGDCSVVNSMYDPAPTVAQRHVFFQVVHASPSKHILLKQSLVVAGAFYIERIWQLLRMKP